MKATCAGTREGIGQRKRLLQRKGQKCHFPKEVDLNGAGIENKVSWEDSETANVDTRRKNSFDNSVLLFKRLYLLKSKKKTLPQDMHAVHRGCVTTTGWLSNEHICYLQKVAFQQNKSGRSRENAQVAFCIPSRTARSSRLRLQQQCNGKETATGFEGKGLLARKREKKR